LLRGVARLDDRLVMLLDLERAIDTRSLGETVEAAA
jgi:chemotaxis signal transduction protein